MIVGEMLKHQNGIIIVIKSHLLYSIVLLQMRDQRPQENGFVIWEKWKLFKVSNI